MEDPNLVSFNSIRNRKFNRFNQRAQMLKSIFDCMDNSHIGVGYIGSIDEFVP